MTKLGPICAAVGPDMGVQCLKNASGKNAHYALTTLLARLEFLQIDAAY